MRIPDSLSTLAEYGIISDVERSLMSGKEAEVYLVHASGERRVAKIYKDAQNRTFKHRADYTEGRKTRNTRDQRAMGKRSTHGKATDEAAWRETEVSMIYRLQAAGVRVPVPYNFIDGVLVMELVVDAHGEPAPRLGDVSFSREEAQAIFARLIQEVVRMLCAGVVHGDLSDFNVLLGADGPVIIDFPQSVDPAHNTNARKLLLRDVSNLHDFLARYDRNAPRLPYAEEMWALYESNQLAPETVLTGRWQSASRRADTSSVMRLVDEAKRDERRRREALGIKSGRDLSQPQGPRPAQGPSQPRHQARSQGPSQPPHQSPRPPQPPHQSPRPSQPPHQSPRSPQHPSLSATPRPPGSSRRRRRPRPA
ncbi:MAG: PA4780 family RIO1-like protein kinase [Polyangia bacterium]